MSNWKGKQKLQACVLIKTVAVAKVTAKLFFYLTNVIPIIKEQDVSVCLKLKILITTEPIGLYYSGNIPTGPVMVLRYFLGGCDTLNFSQK